MARTGTFVMKAGANVVTVAASGTAADSMIVATATNDPGQASGQIALSYVTKSAGVGFIAHTSVAPSVNTTFDYTIS